MSERKRYVSIALLLSFVLSPFASMLYLGRGRRAIAYLLLIILAGLSPLLMEANAVVRYWPVVIVGIWMVGLADSARVARHHRQEFSGPWYSTWYGVAGMMALLALVHVANRTFVVTAVRMTSAGMEPALIVSDYVLASRWNANAPRRGDIVVFRHPATSHLHTSRVTGTPGETVTYREKRVTVPPEHYFVLGDNRDKASDSRHWGFVPAANLLGIASTIWWNADAPQRTGMTLR